MVDSTVLVERLVAADDECKRLRHQLKELTEALDAAHRDAVGLRGSCRAMGEELKHAKRGRQKCQRALSWLMHNRNIEIEGIPGWLLYVLNGILKYQAKPPE